jgi:hypothetical protein
MASSPIADKFSSGRKRAVGIAFYDSASPPIEAVHIAAAGNDLPTERDDNGGSDECAHNHNCDADHHVS